MKTKLSRVLQTIGNGINIVYAGFSKFFCGSLFFQQSNAARDTQCTSWYRVQSDLLLTSIANACPPLFLQAFQDWRYERESLNEIGVVCCFNAINANYL